MTIARPAMWSSLVNHPGYGDQTTGTARRCYATRRTSSARLTSGRSCGMRMLLTTLTSTRTVAAISSR